jgi:hypothetical protein
MLSTVVLFIAIATAQIDTDFVKKDTSDIHATLVAASLPVADWIQSLNQKPYDLLCLGESHEDFFREFYGAVLKDLEFPVLAIETTQEELVKIQDTWKATKQAKLLNANYAPILQSLEGKTPTVRIAPVEATKLQDQMETKYTIETGKSHLSRDGFIAQNILKQTAEGNNGGTKIVALYGRNHCSKNNTGLGSVSFANFLGRSKKVLSVMLLKRQSKEKINPLVAYLDAGVEGSKPVLVLDSSKIKDEDHNFNWEMKSILDNFDYVIVY